MNSVWNRYEDSLVYVAGAEMVAGGGALAIGSSTTAILGGSAGVTAAGGSGAITAEFLGCGILVVGGVIVIKIGIDFLEGNGADRTQAFFNRLFGRK